jgi:hypothetical protein
VKARFAPDIRTNERYVTRKMPKLLNIAQFWLLEF